MTLPLMGVVLVLFLDLGLSIAFLPTSSLLPLVTNHNDLFLL